MINGRNRENFIIKKFYYKIKLGAFTTKHIIIDMQPKVIEITSSTFAC